MTAFTITYILATIFGILIQIWGAGIVKELKPSEKPSILFTLVLFVPYLNILCLCGRIVGLCVLLRLRKDLNT